MKFAVICVSLLIAAHADSAGQRNQMKALDFPERGARLRLELERAYQDLFIRTKSFSSSRFRMRDARKNSSKSFWRCSS